MSINKGKSDSKPEPKDTIDSMDLDSLIQLLEIAYNLKKAFDQGEEISSYHLTKDKALMSILFEYMLINMDRGNIDIELLKFLEKFLGIKLNKDKENEQEKEQEEKEEELEQDREQEQEHLLSKEEKDRRYRLAMYEIYKILNPRQLAGETALENFIKNVRTRGIETALKYEGAEHVLKFQKTDLENLESHRYGFVQALKDHGAIGGGRRM